MISILLVNPKFAHNVGSVVRAASCYGGGNVYYTGDRVDLSGRLPREERMKGYADAPWKHVAGPRPIDAILRASAELIPVAVELLPGSEPLHTFQHPENVLYVFGPEDGSLPDGIRRNCHRFIQIPSNHCLNLAAAAYTVLYDRMVKRVADGLQEPPSIDAEGRGVWHV